MGEVGRLFSKSETRGGRLLAIVTTTTTTTTHKLFPCEIYAGIRIAAVAQSVVTTLHAFRKLGES